MSRNRPPVLGIEAGGGGAGSGLVMIPCRNAPICPSSIALFRAAALGSKRRLKPTSTGTGVLASEARQRSTLAMSRSIGFSHRIALPAAAARSIRSTWVLVGVQITIASTSFPAVKSSACVVHSHWCACANARAAASIGSATALSRVRGWRATLAAWILPIRPAPMTAMRNMRWPPLFFVEAFYASSWADRLAIVNLRSAPLPSPRGRAALLTRELFNAKLGEQGTARQRLQLISRWSYRDEDSPPDPGSGPGPLSLFPEDPDC